MPGVYDRVDVDGLGEAIDGSDGPRQPLSRNPRDTISNSNHDGVGRLNDQDELHDTQDQLAEAKMILEAYAKELKQTRAEMRRMAHRINDLEHERQRLKEDNQSYENEHRRLKESNVSYENELSIIRRKLQDANLASTDGKELVGAQVFPAKPDTLSISDVVDKVNNLNEEIFQAAALLGEALIYRPHDVPQDEMNYALGITQGMVGGKIINILREQSLKDVPEANPLIVQVVLQVFLVAYCSQMVQSWSSDGSAASYLAAVYSRIRDKEEQAVSGRWRALTRSHTRPRPEGWKKDLLRKLGSVLRVAAWMTPSVQRRDAFEQKLEPIFRVVEDLRNALGEKFTSADLEVSVMEADQLFHPGYMDDAYGDPDRKHAPPEVVIGTTGIGLKKAMLKRSTKGEVMYESVLSAKVALESTILEALNPPPPKKNRRRIIKPNEEDLPPPPKEVMTSKPQSPASHPPAHPSQRAAAAGPSQPPALPRTNPTFVKIVQPQQRHGTLPESPEGTVSAAPGLGPQQSGQQRKPIQRSPLPGSPVPQEGGVGAAVGPQQSGLQRDGQNPQSKEKPEGAGGIVAALIQMGILSK